MSIFDQIQGSGAATSDIFTALRLMQPPTDPNRPHRVAAPRSVKPVADVASPDDFVGTPLFAQTDEEMVRNQLALTGGVGAEILQEHAGPDVFKPRMVDGRMDYTGMQPVRGMEDLLSNRTFQTLARQDPHRASTIYKELTGKDFSKDYSEMEKQRVAKESDLTNSIRDQIMKGDMRRHPTQGWLERAVTEPGDPISGKPAVKTWEPVDASVLQADIDYGRKALGYSRPETPVDRVPMVHRNFFMQEYYAQQKAGKDDKTALNMATQKLHSSFPQMYKQPAGRNDVTPTATPTVVKANPEVVPTGQAAYQEYMTRKARAGQSRVGDFLRDTVPAAVDKAADATIGNLVRAGSVVARDVVGGITDAWNQLDVAAGEAPMNPWSRHIPFKEITNPESTEFPAWMRSGAWRRQ